MQHKYAEMLPVLPKANLYHTLLKIGTAFHTWYTENGPHDLGYTCSAFPVQTRFEICGRGRREESGRREAQGEIQLRESTATKVAAAVVIRRRH